MIASAHISRFKGVSLVGFGMAGLARHALFFACVFAIHFFSEYEVLCAKGLKRTTGEGLSYANFFDHLFHYLDVSKVATYLAHKLEDCAAACVRSTSCFSFNLAARPDINGLYLCELLASDKHNSSDKFLSHLDFHHYSIYTPCTENPCKNGGTCIALYYSDDFECKCPAGFIGKKCERAARNCSAYLKAGVTTNGVYAVDPDGEGAFSVYCDMTTDRGGWTVFQRRQDGSQDFYLGWSEYKAGFGNLTGEFWLGLDKIHRLTAKRTSELRVEIEDWSGGRAYAKYGSFGVGDEQSLYRLSVGSYSGTAGDSLTSHNNAKFTTKDRDNDAQSGGSCAVTLRSSWWFRNCHPSNLNGQYLGDKRDWSGIIWYYNCGTLSLKFAEMKLRPTN